MAVTDAAGRNPGCKTFILLQKGCGKVLDALKLVPAEGAKSLLGDLKSEDILPPIAFVVALIAEHEEMKSEN